MVGKFVCDFYLFWNLLSGSQCNYLLVCSLLIVVNVMEIVVIHEGRIFIHLFFYISPANRCRGKVKSWFWFLKQRF